MIHASHASHRRRQRGSDVPLRLRLCTSGRTPFTCIATVFWTNAQPSGKEKRCRPQLCAAAAPSPNLSCVTPHWRVTLPCIHCHPSTNPRMASVTTAAAAGKCMQSLLGAAAACASKQVGEELGRKLGRLQLHRGHEVDQLGMHLRVGGRHKTQHVRAGSGRRRMAIASSHAAHGMLCKQTAPQQQARAPQASKAGGWGISPWGWPSQNRTALSRGSAACGPWMPAGPLPCGAWGPVGQARNGKRVTGLKRGVEGALASRRQPPTPPAANRSPHSSI